MCLWSNVPSSRDSEFSTKKDPRQQMARMRSVGRDEISIVGRWKNGMQTSAYSKPREKSHSNDLLLQKVSVAISCKPRLPY
jgi:hypothetical protein